MTLGLPEEQGGISTLNQHYFWNTNVFSSVYSSPFANYIHHYEVQNPEHNVEYSWHILLKKISHMLESNSHSAGILTAFLPEKSPVALSSWFILAFCDLHCLTNHILIKEGACLKNSKGKLFH